MMYASPHYLPALSAYCHLQTQAVADFKAGKVPRRVVSPDTICEVLDGGPQYFPTATADDLATLYGALQHIAHHDPDLHDLAVSRMRDVSAELHRYDND